MDDGSTSYTYSFVSRKPKLLSVAGVDNIDNVSNGTPKTAVAFGLPEKIVVEVEGNGISEADVTWDLDNLYQGSYDASVLEAQVFTVVGTVEIPDMYDLDSVATDVLVKISVQEASKVEAPVSSIAPGTYTENQELELTTGTEGAKIYYTMDGSLPDKDNGILYSKAILVSGTPGEESKVVVRAIAVKDGMYDSDVNTYEYVIIIPLKQYTVIQGVNGSWETNQNSDYSIITDGNANDLENILVDNDILETDNYQIDSNTGEIIIKKDYLSSLEPGKHTVSIIYSDGSAETDFTILSKENSENENPESTESESTESESTESESTESESAGSASIESGNAVQGSATQAGTVQVSTVQGSTIQGNTVSTTTEIVGTENENTADENIEAEITETGSIESESAEADSTETDTIKTKRKTSQKSLVLKSFIYISLLGLICIIIFLVYKKRKKEEEE